MADSNAKNKVEEDASDVVKMDEVQPTPSTSGQRSPQNLKQETKDSNSHIQSESSPNGNSSETPTLPVSTSPIREEDNPRVSGEVGKSGGGEPSQRSRSESSSSNSSSSSSYSSSSSNSSNSTFSLLSQLRREQILNKKTFDMPDVILKSKPKHNWFMTPEIVKREIGFPNRRQGFKKFEERVYGSLHAVQRLELMYKLDEHIGCVNSVSFNQSGSLLASCSDDRRLCLWDWAAGKLLGKVKTGHRGNVVQCKFLPLQGHLHFATSAYDGEVRLLEMDASGHVSDLRRIGQHRRAVHKLALPAGSQHCFLSCGEDAEVFSFDIRKPKFQRLLTVRNDDNIIPLYSVSCHPIDENEFMVAGKNEYVRLYDRRQCVDPILKLSPSHMQSVKTTEHHVTSAVYSYNGTELLASYNDEDIYLWDRTNTSNTDFVHRYQGHRNKDTVKGVNFFGPRSEFIVSGSDCHFLYFWDKETEAIVQWLEGDENGTVNCAEPHPSVPVLATSGFDPDVKIWVPSKEEEPDLEDLKATVTNNIQDREMDKMEEQGSGDMDTQMLWLLWRHLGAPAASISPIISSNSVCTYRPNRRRRSTQSPQPSSGLAEERMDTSTGSDDSEDASAAAGSDTENINYTECSPS